MTSHKKQRIADLSPADMSDRQKRLFHTIAGTRGGLVRGPFAIWLRHPDLVEKADDFGSHLRSGTDVPPRLSELAILVTARFSDASYEWYAHAGAAKKAGISPENIEAIRAGSTPVFLNADEQCVYDLSKELYETKFVSDETYSRAIELLDQDRVIDLVAIIGFYSMVALTLNAFHAPLPEGAEDPFSD